jgi:hypothetical protein
MKKREESGWTYRFAATDGHRLFVIDIPLPGATGDRRPALHASRRTDADPRSSRHGVLRRPYAHASLGEEKITLFAATPGLHLTEADTRLQSTHLGQAHIAGTGPAGATCRECRFYAMNRKGWPEFYGGGKNGALKQAKCGYEIGGKSTRQFPHSARACSFFERNDNPPPAFKPVGQK